MSMPTAPDYPPDVADENAPAVIPRPWLVLAFLAIFLISHSALAQSPTENLMRAVELNDLTGVEAAIAAGADLAAKNNQGMTAADIAVDLGHFRIAHVLLAKRTEAKSTAPRVTEKGTQALTQPRARIAAPSAGAAPKTPDPRLSKIVPPRKPIKAPTRTPATDEPSPAAPSTPSGSRDLAEPGPVPGAAEPVPGAPEVMPSPPEPRPDDEIARSTPSETDPSTAPDRQEAAGAGDGLLGSIWGGIKSVATLGGLLGGGDQAPQRPSDETSPEDRPLTSPADRFSSNPARDAPSESAAGRMVDRMKDMVASEAPAENEFGLPTEPVVPPLTEPRIETAERPPLADPTLSMPGLAAPEMVLPPADSGALDGEMPGLVVPVPGDDPIETPIAGLPETSTDPSFPDPEIPGLPSGMDIPGLATPELGSEPSPGTGVASPSVDVPGLPPGLDIPGVAASEPIEPSPADEIPGIIPPPGPVTEIPGLPPGIEPLPGTDGNRLRRPGGLIEPRDTSVLPPPGSDDLRERLRRLDEVLNRSPTQRENPYSAPRTQPQQPVRQAPSKAPVETAPSDPLMEIPRGLDGELVPPPAPRSERRSTEEILRRARESDAVLRERERHAPRSSADPDVKPTETSPHRLQPRQLIITERKEPASRMFDRLSRLGSGDKPQEDIHGLPIAPAPRAGEPIPRETVEVTELEQVRREKTDEKIRALARFFRGDQEEVSGMQPPEPQVQSQPLSRVVDNLIPENDPARQRIVDDKMLDLSGVENTPPSFSGQPGAAPTKGGQLNDSFLDRLTTVLGPSADRVPAKETVPAPEPGRVGLGDLNVPQEQLVPIPKPDIPDPWTMTIERKGPEGEKQTLGVSAISPEDGSEMVQDRGVVQQMVGRIRQLLGSPEEKGSEVPDVSQLDDEERQAMAERLLSDALREGPPTALPDQNQWPVTEIEASGGPPGVPPTPRPGALSRTSLEDVILSMGESVTLENTLPPQQDGIDPLNECVKKNRGTTLFCVEPVDWPDQLRDVFVVPTILYTGPMAITRYDQGSPSRFHALFASEDFEDVVAYYQARYGEPTEIWQRSIAPLAKPRMDNPTVTWRSLDTRSNVVTALEIRKFDDTRGGFPDTTRGAVMLYHLNAPSIFPQVSSHELMRLRRTR